MTNEQNESKKVLNTEELESVSGGEAAIDYYGRKLYCTCGYDDFQCLGFDPEKRGYNMKCNSCGKVMFVYR